MWTIRGSKRTASSQFRAHPLPSRRFATAPRLQGRERTRALVTLRDFAAHQLAPAPASRASTPDLQSTYSLNTWNRGAAIRDLVDRVVPWDEREVADRERLLGRIHSGEPLFRVAKPAMPPQHLAVYAALIDDRDMSVMLVHHLAAQAWLLPGGHVDEGEDPRWTVRRELGEELQVAPAFHPVFGEDPVFLTITQTRGMGSHLDATLWFAFAFDRSAVLTPDDREFTATKWLSLVDAASWDQESFDPEMGRFVSKLTHRLRVA